MPTKSTPSAVTREIGSTGLNRWGGIIYEEFLPELRGVRGMRKLREMSENDEIVGAILYAIEMLLRQVEFRIEPASEGGAKAEDVADFVEGCLFKDMSQPWQHTLSDILTMLPYGFALLEVVYKKRAGFSSKDDVPSSRYDDGKLGWRKWAIRGQDTISEWIFDESGGVQGCIQQAPPMLNAVTLPIDRCLLFRVTARKNNPEGRSILRNAYRSWFFKRRIQEIEGIGIERDLAGLPMLTPPENLDLWNPNDPAMATMRAQAEQMVRTVRRDEQEGIVKPYGWEFELLSTGSRRQFDTNAIITRYDQRIAMSVMADFVMIGHDAVGSKALAASKVRVFATALDSVLDAIEDVINRIAIPRLLEVNGIDPLLAPTLAHGDIEAPELAELSEFVSKLVGAGVPLFPNTEVERALLKTAKLPLPADGMGLSDLNPAPEAQTDPVTGLPYKEPAPPPVPGEAKDEDEAEDAEDDVAGAEAKAATAAAKDRAARVRKALAVLRGGA